MARGDDRQQRVTVCGYMNPVENEWIKELDGLRAVAVLLVLLFHAQLDFFQGGGVGVDIFFVISGFIITLKLYLDSQAGPINLITFWQNRFARLVPAMLAVSIFVFAFSPMFFAGDALARIYQATIASLIYISNFFFMAEAGYFDTSSLAKPMLHTWSLAVEEQFYLIWPLLMIGLFKLPKRLWLYGLGAMAAASLAFAFWSDAINPSIAFYMMPARIYEFCAGAIIAISAVNLRGVAGGTSFAVGLAGLVAVAVLVDPAGDGLILSHVAPTVLTALVIAAIRSPLSSAILATPPAVFLGKISYSVYLAHWPLMVFYFNQSRIDLGGFAWLVLIAASIGAGYLMHRFIETRFRFHKGFGEAQRRTVLWTVAVSTALTVGAAALVAPTLRPAPTLPPSPQTAQVDADDGSERARILAAAAFLDRNRLRLDMQERALYGECSFTFTGTYAVQQDALAECVAPVAGRTNILVIGSSVSDGVFVSLADALSRENYHVLKAGLAACDPHAAPDAFTMSPQEFQRICRDFNATRLRLTLENDFDVVVLAGQWFNSSIEDLASLIGLVRESGAVPVLIGPSPYFTQVT